MAPGSAAGVDPDVAERQALGRVAHALRHYRVSAEWEIARWEHNWRQLSPHHRAMVPRQPAKIAEARQCVYRNHVFLRALLSLFHEGGGDEGLAPPHLAPANAAADEHEAAAGSAVSPHDQEKSRYVLKNVARDWSAEGAAERAASYGRILGELRRLFAAAPPGAREPPAVLVPGAGLARLCLEIVNEGFRAEGNEFSYFMLLASAYLLNGVERERQWTIHPWALSSCNQPSADDQLRGVQVPDVHPAELVPAPGLLSMSAGDFAEVYSAPGQAGRFDAVAACFFLDTAHNVLRYLEAAWATLKPGGYLVHLGPLQWHWADAHTYLGAAEPSLELTLEELRAAALQIGFRLVREEEVEAPFLADACSMLQASTYRCAFWTLQKPGGTAAPHLQPHQHGAPQQQRAPG